MSFFLYKEVKMSFRVVLIENEVKLSLKLKNLVVNKDGQDIWIPLDDISIIVVDNLNTNITTRMLSILSEENISLVICDKNHLPSGCFVAYENHSRASKMIQYQIDFNNEMKNELWDEIVKAKIMNQKETLRLLKGHDVELSIFDSYANEVFNGDETNREGIAAKAYFTRLMGTAFSRSNDDILLNSGLDYGYSIVRSYLSRLLIAYGFNCQLGIHHKSEYNAFNLVDDIMEPVRPILDICAYRILDGQKYFLPEHRRYIVNFVNHYIKYNRKEMYIGNMLEEYVVQIVNSIKNKKIQVIFPCAFDYIGNRDEV